MNRKFKRKSLSLLLTLAMIICLFFGLTAPASAACGGNWENQRDTTWYTTYSGGNSFPIADGADLAAFAYQVNNGNTFADKYVYLTNDIYLSTYCWKPIGGQWNNPNGYPPASGPGSSYFAGTFDGKDYTIHDMEFSINQSGVGLFGYSCGGRIANLTVSGVVYASGNYAAVGGIVGYTNGSIFNCTSNVTVECSSNVSNVGGVAGVVEVKCDESGDPVLVQYCTNNGSVSSESTRIGGVVGATYVTANNEDAINVDRCTNNGTVKTSSAAYKTFIGGIVGYCQSNISNCVNTGTINASSGDDGHRMGGVVGILNGYSSIYARMANCINIGAIINGYPGGSFDGALCYDEGGTSPPNITTLDNSFYINTPYGDQTRRGIYTNVLQLTEAQFKSVNYCGDLATAVPWSWSGIAGNAYTCGAGFYPYITDSASSSDYYEHPEELPACCNVASSCTEPSGVYYDPDYAGGDDNGTFDRPYHIFSTAVGAGNTIILKGAVTSAALSGVSLDGKTIKRSCAYNGYLFDLTQSWNANNITLVIDGNSTSSENRSLINVEGDEATVIVTLGSGVTLQNNRAANNGAAIRMLGGTVNMYGTIKANSTFANGGGVAVMDDPDAGTHGIFNLYGTIGISGYGNTAGNYGGGLYVGVNGEAYLKASAVIRYNSALDCGGVDNEGYCDKHGSATITDNTPNQTCGI